LNPDLRCERDRIDQVLARHLVVDAKRHPSHRPVGLPLALDAAARDRGRRLRSGLRVDVGDGAGGSVARDRRHLQHHPGARRNRQERRIGGTALRPERRQDDRLHLVVSDEHRDERRVEAAGAVRLGRAHELVVEPEAVEESAKAGIVAGAERRIAVVERIGHLRQRPSEIRPEPLRVGDVVGDLAQAIHVVGEADEPGRNAVAGQHPEGVAHHRGARHLAECADMREAGGAVAGLEQHLAATAPRLVALQQLARLLERPGLRDARGFAPFGGEFGRCHRARCRAEMPAGTIVTGLG
jgi:hypothetical protein